ncbi:MAG TPA: sigma-70 family RNA polymerase sigma factor [Myxococcus sp.]|nr:sigma-70 family RNA polymerase sigma factor [Myxococcus sp.]
MPSRALHFAHHLRPEARGHAELPGLEAVLASLYAAGREVWPGVPLSEEDFLRHLAERLPPGGDTAAVLAAVHAADLYLACACARGEPAAHEALERQVLPKAAAAVARLKDTGVEVAEVLQHLRERLLVAGEGRAPRMAEYQGGGPLAAWVRAAAVRTALNLRRARGRRERAEEDAEAGTLAAGTGAVGDVELDYLRRHHREDFHAALAEALAALPSRDRTVLRLHVVEGLALERLGAMYRTHKSTVSRWVAKAREDVLAEARQRLAERLRLSPDELHSLMRAVHSHLDLSLPSLLREPGSSSSSGETS